MARTGALKKVGKHFKDVRTELKKVHWPNRKELYLYSSIVLGTIIVIGIFFWVLDSGFTAILQRLIQ